MSWRNCLPLNGLTALISRSSAQDVRIRPRDDLGATTGHRRRPQPRSEPPVEEPVASPLSVGRAQRSAAIIQIACVQIASSSQRLRTTWSQDPKR